MPTVPQNPPKSGVGSLLQEFGYGLLRLVLAVTGALLGYCGYLLTPHLREALYGHFGAPVSNLDRLSHWLRESLGVAEKNRPKNGGNPKKQA